MPAPTDSKNRFAFLRAKYDSAFEILCHATTKLQACLREGVLDDRCRRLESAAELSQLAYTRARNELAGYLLEKRGTAYQYVLYGLQLSHKAAARAARMVD